MRIEKDYLGELKIDKNAYYGIHTKRAEENFKLNYKKVHPELINALALVKKAAAVTNNELGYLNNNKANAITAACDEIIEGKFSSQFIVDALQGGAGTSLNMNINEVITNRALEIMGFEKGSYEKLHPIEDVNLHQSTNDVYPTALKIAVIFLLRKLADSISNLQRELQNNEKEFSEYIKLARTELQDAVPLTLGSEFGAYSEAIARDRWRVFKSEERLRVVNIGGTAIGTGTAAPRKYIFLVIEKLREITGLGIARAENLIDATQNQDAFIEVSGILKAHSANLFKIANDLRLASSGPTAGLHEINLPLLQSGSSIMPAKFNPVIPEMIQQISIKCTANDFIITDAIKNSNFELAQFLPLAADSLIETLKLLTNADNLFTEKCIKGITPNKKQLDENVKKSFEIITLFIPYIGYEQAGQVVKQALKQNKTITEILKNENILPEEKISKILTPENILSLGFRDE